MRMPTFDERLCAAIISKYGTKVDLAADTELLKDVISEIQREGSVHFPTGDDQNYDKTYTESYNKEDYSKANYSRYDKTADGDLWDDIKKLVNPEVQRLIIERFQLPTTGPAQNRSEDE
jgi:hypothetical protein